MCIHYSTTYLFIFNSYCKKEKCKSGGKHVPTYHGIYSHWFTKVIEEIQAKQL